jgi:hypothetical protein
VAAQQLDYTETVAREVDPAHQDNKVSPVAEHPDFVSELASEVGSRNLLFIFRAGGVYGNKREKHQDQRYKVNAGGSIESRLATRQGPGV